MNGHVQTRDKRCDRISKKAAVHGGELGHAATGIVIKQTGILAGIPLVLVVGDRSGITVLWIDQTMLMWRLERVVRHQAGVARNTA